MIIYCNDFCHLIITNSVKTEQKCSDRCRFQVKIRNIMRIFSL